MRVIGPISLHYAAYLWSQWLIYQSKLNDIQLTVWTFYMRHLQPNRMNVKPRSISELSYHSAMLILINSRQTKSLGACDINDINNCPLPNGDRTNFTLAECPLFLFCVRLCGCVHLIRWHWTKGHTNEHKHTICINVAWNIRICRYISGTLMAVNERRKNCKNASAPTERNIYN